MKLILYRGKVKVDPKSLKTKELINLYNRDKKESTKALLYVYLAKDEESDNPFRNLSYKEREKEAEMRIYGEDGIPEDWVEDIQRAMDTYPLTEEQISIYTYNKKMDELGELLRNTKPKIQKNEHATTGTVSFTTNIDIINAILKDITNIIQAKASLVALYTTGRIPKYLRGGLSPLATGKIKTKEK